MTFLNPLLLIGLAAAAIPILIHLFNLRKPRQVAFSSLAFLQELQKSTMRRVRVKQWLLLALRVLALACLALGFARPLLRPTGEGSRPPASVLILLDNSLSMTLRDARGAYLDQAKQLASDLAEGLGDGDEVFLLRASADPGQRPSPFRERAALLDAIAETTPATGTYTLTSLIDRGAALLEDATHPIHEIYLITDLQTSTLTDSAASVPFGGRLVLLKVGDAPASNVAVTEVGVASRIVEAGQPVVLNATIANYGREAVEDYVASVFVEGVRVAQTTVSLGPGEAREATFTFTPDRRGWLGGFLSGEPDAFEADDRRFFTLHVPERRRVLVVRGEGARTDFLELALSPALRGGQATFEVTSIPEAQLAATPLPDFDVLVLAGPRSLSSGEAQSLARYVQEGGGIFMTPGDSPEALNGLLANLGGGTLGGALGEAGAIAASFGHLDREHPVFAGIFDEGRGEAERPEIYRYAPYRGGGRNEHTLIALTNGTPFLQEIRSGTGTTLLLSAAPERDWTDLPVRGLFVPLLYRSLFYLSASENVQSEEATVGKPSSLQVTGIGGDARVQLIGPEGEEFTPEQRALFNATLLETDASITTPGLYDVRAGEALVRRIAFNLDARESDPRVLDDARGAEKITQVTGARVLTIEAENALEKGAQAALPGASGAREFWNELLGLALLFLVAEMFVARRWRPEAGHA